MCTTNNKVFCPINIAVDMGKTVSNSWDRRLFDNKKIKFLMNKTVRKLNTIVNKEKFPDKEIGIISRFLKNSKINYSRNEMTP